MFNITIDSRTFFDLWHLQAAVKVLGLFTDTLTRYDALCQAITPPLFTELLATRFEGISVGSGKAITSVQSKLFHSKSINK